MTTESAEPAPAAFDAFEVAFDDPAHADLTWERDDMHMPFALSPLASDYVRLLGAGMNARYEQFSGFPQRWRAAVWNGYAYFAIDLDPKDRATVVRAWEAVCRAQIETVGRWWAEAARPELIELYRRIASIDVDGLTGKDLAEAWSEAWEHTLRAWGIHFLVILGPYQVIDDLADAFEKAVPDAPAGEALRLIQGFGDEMFDVEVGIGRLAALAVRTPAVAARLRATDRVERNDLLAVDGGAAFVDELDGFLEVHGHLGQGFDDLALPSWVEEPRLLLAEVAKRIERPAASAARRRERLIAEADAVADRARQALTGRPEELATFERLLASARDIGPLTEGHNYWIDRMAQSRLRTLVTRVGRRLVADGSLDDRDDVFLLYRAEVADALREPSDMRPLVAQRRAEHARWRELRPPAIVGKPRTEELPPDRFDGQRLRSEDPNLLRGTGASAGVARGAARVTLSPDDFARIMPGDIIVCPSSNPSWVPVFAIAGGLVTNTGGVLSHAAVVAREFGLPAVVGTGEGTSRIADGRMVEIDGTSGTVRLL